MGMSSRSCRENDPDNFFAIVLLGCPNLEAPDLVDAETHALLGAFVERGGGSLQGLLEPQCLRLSGHPAVPRRRLGTILLALPAGDALVRCPRRGEEGARALLLEGLPKEVACPLLPHPLLLADELAQLLGVVRVRVRGQEHVPLLAPVGHVRVEHGLQQALVLVLQRRPGAIAQHLPEGAPDDRASTPRAGHLPGVRGRRRG
mmetsp:Transcript_70394/g.198669  ORF Transcript_70394/g.198669 Transcript_70394/m.198669 type:complete len:203 (+) Transcript_70394:1117-1725(+)